MPGSGHAQPRVTEAARLVRCAGAIALSLAAAAGAAAQAGGAASAPTVTEASRHALVIGNSRYADVSVLPNVANDLEDMCAALRSLRFRTTCLADVPTRKAFVDAVEAFVASAPPGANTVLYFGGHALQVAGENYLIPTQVSSADPRGWLPQFVRLSELFQVAERARAGFQFIVLDACRDDPEAKRVQPAPARAASASSVAARRAEAGRNVMRSMLATVRSSARFASYGIAAVRDAPRNTLVLFATGAGAYAFDGDGERNGPLTKHLLMQMRRPQLHIDQVVKNVIQAVGDDTERRYRRRQSPSLYGTFAGEFCFNGCPQLVSVEQLEEERRGAAERERLERERRDREQQRQRRENVIVPTL
jgi:uncharacterized caspase-like protein